MALRTGSGLDRLWLRCRPYPRAVNSIIRKRTFCTCAQCAYFSHMRAVRAPVLISRSYRTPHCDAVGMRADALCLDVVYAMQCSNNDGPMARATIAWVAIVRTGIRVHVNFRAHGQFAYAHPAASSYLTGLGVLVVHARYGRSTYCSQPSIIAACARLMWPWRGAGTAHRQQSWLYLRSWPSQTLNNTPSWCGLQFPARRAAPLRLAVERA